MQRITIGSVESDHIIMIADDDSSDGWIGVEVDLKSGPFAGTYRASMMKGEIEMFRKSVGVLYETLSGVAEFHTIEGQLRFMIRGNGRGSMTVKGYGFGRSDNTSKLEFEFEIDQTYLPTIITPEELA